jgi:glycosyltransferase involved in cell wall biosynthesis
MTTTASPDGGAAKLLLHVFPGFGLGGAQVRFCAIANRFGPRWRHAVIALDGVTDAARRLSPAVPLSLLPSPERFGEGPLNLLRFRRVLTALRPSLLVTSNWGSIEWAAVARTVPGLRHLHTEDGFGPDEANGQKARRMIARRLVLGRSDVVLPSRTLLAAARDRWRLPSARLHYIPNGIDLAAFAPDGPVATIDLPGEGPVIGTVARLRPEKRIDRLLRACALLRDEGAGFRLAVVGDGAEQPALERLAAALGLADRVRFLGHMAEPAGAYRRFDVVALSSDTEQMPFSILEAMASGRAVAATDVGDVRAMLPEAQAPFLAARDDAALAAVLRPLLADAALRQRLGAANRARAEADFDQEAMFAAYAALFDGAGERHALGRHGTGGMTRPA